MTVTTEPRFYDRDAADPDALCRLPLESSPWLPLYVAAAEMVSWDAGPVVDLGCGTGRFARLLTDRGVPVSGVDFGEAAIRSARDYAKDASFEVCDLRVWEPGPVEGATVFTCLEVLEHLEDDLDLVGRVPGGHRLIFSVPSYPSESHVRVFRHVADVFARYERLVDVTAWRALDMGPVGRRIHLVDSRRRADSWS